VDLLGRNHHPYLFSSPSYPLRGVSERERRRPACRPGAKPPCRVPVPLAGRHTLSVPVILSAAPSPVKTAHPTCAEVRGGKTLSQEGGHSGSGGRTTPAGGARRAGGMGSFGRGRRPSRPNRTKNSPPIS